MCRIYIWKEKKKKNKKQRQTIFSYKGTFLKIGLYWHPITSWLSKNLKTWGSLKLLVRPKTTIKVGLWLLPIIKTFWKIYCWSLAFSLASKISTSHKTWGGLKLLVWPKTIMMVGLWILPIIKTFWIVYCWSLAFFLASWISSNK